MRIYPTPIIVPRRPSSVSTDQVIHPKTYSKPKVKTKVYSKLKFVLDITDDICYQIMTFLDLKFILTTCTLISKQWLSETVHIKLRYTIKSSVSAYSVLGKMAESESKYISNITDLDFSPQFIENQRLDDYGIKCISKVKNIRNLVTLTLSLNHIHNNTLEYFVSQDITKTLTHLKLDGNYLTGEGILALTNSENMKNLKYLNVSYNELEDDAILYISQSQYLHNLTSLDVSRNNITKNGVEILCDSPNLHQLQTLSFDRTNIGDEGMIALAKCKKFPNLTTLNVCESEIGFAGMISFSKSLYFPKLRKLALSRNLSIGDEPIIELSNNPAMQNMQKLVISKIGLTDNGLKSIAMSENMKNLKSLSINYNNIHEDGIDCLMSSDYMSKLITIDVCFHHTKDNLTRKIVNGNNMKNIKYLSIYEEGDYGTQLIAGAENVRNVTSLDYRLVDITGVGVEILCKSQYLINLRVLYLSGNPIGPEGAYHLSRCENLNNLTQLRLFDCKIKDEGVGYLANSIYLNNVYDMSLKSNGITFIGVESICRTSQLKGLRVLDICLNNLGDTGKAWLLDVKRFEKLTLKENY